MTEDEARMKYEAVTGNLVLQTGLVISSSQPWLACSPDGIITGSNRETVALEIKCPKSCEGGPISVKYLKEGKLKKSDPYYTQCQLQMYVCGLKKCDFFVYSSVDFVLDHIGIDMEFL